MNDIKAIVAEIAAKFHAQLVEQYTNNAQATIAAWQKLCAEKNVTDPRHLWPTSSTRQARWEYFRNQQAQQAIAPYIQVDDPKPTYSFNEARKMALRANHAEIIAKRAKEYADAAVAGFIAKMNAKFEGICEAKGNLTKVAANGSLGWNAIRFEFADGSSFDAQNSIVSKWSSKGRPFNQYPTTFHNVVLPDGSRMKNPSESRVKKEFVAAPAKTIKLSGVMVYGGDRCGEDIYDHSQE